MFYGHDDFMGIENFAAGLAADEPECPGAPAFNNCNDIQLTYDQAINVGCKICPPYYEKVQVGTGPNQWHCQVPLNSMAACQNYATKLDEQTEKSCPAMQNPILIGGTCYYPTTHGGTGYSVLVSCAQNTPSLAGPQQGNSLNAGLTASTYYCFGSSKTGPGPEPAPKPTPAPKPPKQPKAPCCPPVVSTGKYDLLKSQYASGIAISPALWQTLAGTLDALAATPPRATCTITQEMHTIFESFNGAIKDATEGEAKRFFDFVPPVNLNMDAGEAYDFLDMNSVWTASVRVLPLAITGFAQAAVEKKYVPQGITDAAATFVATGVLIKKGNKYTLPADSVRIAILKDPVKLGQIIAAIVNIEKIKAMMAPIAPYAAAASKLPVASQCSLATGGSNALHGLADLSTNQKVLLAGGVGVLLWWLLKKR